jgi:PIN domain nuclease of toxin-antitoxin system
VIVVDTHVLLWWQTRSAKLSGRAEKALKSVSQDRPALVSTISLFEIATAVRRGRLRLGVTLDQWLADAAILPELRIEPISGEIARVAGNFGDDLHGDPADRIIAATALVFGVPLLTADERLRGWSGLKTIW